MKRLALLVVVIPQIYAMAQTGTPTPGIIGQDAKNRTITTAVPFLSITPDTRSAALGDAGVATSADANAAYWNAAKLAFAEERAGVSLSYTPWLAKIINDMYIFYLSGYYKISREQTVAVSMKYFDMGNVDLTTIQGEPNGRFNPRDFAFDVTYSRLLTENFSIGGSIRYIHSNLTGSGGSAQDARPGKSVAVDMGVFYTKPLVSKNSNLSLGASITNIGAKMSYSDDGSKDFIPANLRLGGAFETEVSPMNSFTFIMDFNKLLVPSPAEGSREKSLLSGVFGSFGDAQNGFSEEIREIMLSTGVEYWYNKTFAGRVGYFNESYDKGNRKYLTSGVGFKKNKFGLDISYMVPINKRENALAETLRLSLHFTPKFKPLASEIQEDTETP
jgi:Type IX secretion system protein PorV